MTKEPKDAEEVKKGVVKASVETTVYRLAQFMQTFNVGCVVITRQEEPVGIVTDRDLALRIGTSGFDPREITAEDIMQSPITTVDYDSSLSDRIRTMGEQKIRRLPVVEDGELVDIFTMDDLVGELHDFLGCMSQVIESEKPSKIFDERDEGP